MKGKSGMKKFKIIIHSDDAECMVVAANEDEAMEKFDNGEIDEWLTPEWEQSEIKIEEMKG